MVELRHIAALDLSAASGMVEAGGELHVIADDALFLAIYGLHGEPRRRMTLFPGELPADPVARKRQKPDPEALCVLPGGALLALGSGSAPGRARAALIVGARVTLIDVAPLYDRLRAEVPELNIEGAAYVRGGLRLLSRGNGAGRLNALIDVDLERLLRGEVGVRDVVAAPLPTLGGVPLGFTDAAPAGDRLLFSAAAEDTMDPYLDGASAGSAIGLLGLDGQVLALETVGPLKIEGITRVPGGELRMCTDADDPALQAELLGASWPREWPVQ